MNISDQLNRFLAPITNRIRMMLARAVIQTVNDEKAVQQMSISLLAGELRDKVERYQNYGFTSYPRPGMEAFVGFINGDRGNPVIVAVGDREHRVKLDNEGEVCIYSHNGDWIKLLDGNVIEVKSEDTITLKATKTEITLEAPTIKIKGDVVIEGNITTSGGNVKITGDTTATGAVNITGDVGIDGTSTATDHVSTGVSGASHTHVVIGLPTTPPIPTVPTTPAEGGGEG